MPGEVKANVAVPTPGVLPGVPSGFQLAAVPHLRSAPVPPSHSNDYASVAPRRPNEINDSAARRTNTRFDMGPPVDSCRSARGLQRVEDVCKLSPRAELHVRCENVMELK